ncbi:MAG: ParB/RepB/Spo0J family partition protein [Candidatus Omnitrophica bacterium]|nr:ParB/RepB/Spo0J family partition protein [Candidatus Omnitrophota bacterium]
MYQEVKLSQIVLSTTNPRKHVNPEQLAELVESIRKNGVISPITLRKNGKADQFEIVVGERRFRAAKEAKLETIPAVIKELKDDHVLEIQIIENLQRDDLTALEEAQGFKNLLERCKYTQEILAQKINKSQGYIAARMALLDLRKDFLDDLTSGLLAPGHLKHITAINDCNKILDGVKAEMKEHIKYHKDISVREFKRMVEKVSDRRTKSISEANFNTAECKTCGFSRSVKTWNGQTKKCFKPECFHKKQSAARSVEAARIRSKMEKGEVVKGDTMPEGAVRFDRQCNFDKKTCAKCKNRKAFMLKQSYGGSEKTEVCLDKSCFEKKNQAAEAAKVKAEKDAFIKQVEAIKAKAGRAKLDRNFFVLLIAEEINGDPSYDDKIKAVIQAYGIDPKKINSKKAALDYFTGNKSLNVEEIFRFITYWEE